MKMLSSNDFERQMFSHANVQYRNTGLLQPSETTQGVLWVKTVHTAWYVCIIVPVFFGTSIMGVE